LVLLVEFVALVLRVNLMKKVTRDGLIALKNRRGAKSEEKGTRPKVQG
jgi:hypothetical protein